MEHYWIFKKDYNTGKTEPVCNGIYDTAEECSAHWMGYMYAFMDASNEILGTCALSRGIHERSFVLATKDKEIEYFMLMNKAGYAQMELIK